MALSCRVHRVHTTEEQTLELTDHHPYYYWSLADNGPWTIQKNTYIQGRRSSTKGGRATALRDKGSAHVIRNRACVISYALARPRLVSCPDPTQTGKGLVTILGCAESALRHISCDFENERTYCRHSGSCSARSLKLFCSYGAYIFPR